MDPSTERPQIVAETITMAESAIESFSPEPEEPPRFAAVVRPSLPPAPGLLTYEPFYGLTEKPFSLSTDPRFLFRSDSHEPVFHELLGAIQRREGLVVLTGGIGTGKTTLCRAVIGHLDRKTFATFVPDPFVSREDLLKMLLVDFGVVSVDDVRRGFLRGASRVELSYPLYEFLRSLEPLDAYAVLVIDEVQNLSLPLIEEIRILSDLEDGRKLLQVVLVGQPEFRSHLKLPTMKQVDQRVSMRCELQPLTREGVFSYVAHRLSIAGGSKVEFDTASLDLVHEASAGVPRVINLICDRALLGGYRSAAPVIDRGLVASAISDLQITSPPPRDAVVEPINVLEDSVYPRGLFEKPPVAKDASRRVSELHALLDLAPTSGQAADLLVHATSPTDLSARTSIDVQQTLAAVSDSSRGLRLVTTLALSALGTLTGMGLVAYFLWMRPFIAEPLTLPPLPVASRSMEAQVMAFVGVPRLASPSEPAVAAGRWAVQVAALPDTEKARNLLRRLTDVGFPAFEGPRDLASEGRLRLVLVGPYATDTEAALALAQLRQVPGLADAFLTRW